MFLLWQLLNGMTFDGDEGGGNNAGKSDDKKGESGGGDSKAGDTKGEKKSEEGGSKLSAEVQALIDSAAAAARKAGEADGKKAALADAKKKAEDEAATKNGEWEKLAKDRADRLAELEAEVAKRDLIDLKRTIGTKHNLPEEAIGRLVGATPEELEKDAAALAKLVGTREAPKTEAGAGGSNGSKGSGGGTGDESKEKTKVVVPKEVDGQPLIAWPPD